MAAEAAGARAGGGKGAVLWAAFFNFIAFAFFGTKVADTVGQTVKPGFASVAVIFAALLGSILWLRRHEESGNETVFKAGQLVSSAAVSLGHGTNDAQKTMG